MGSCIIFVIDNYNVLFQDMKLTTNDRKRLLLFKSNLEKRVQGHPTKTTLSTYKHSSQMIQRVLDINCRF